MADQDASRPYIGYRSAGRRPERNQDRRAAANAPLSALRGWAAGTAGLPGDLEALVRLLPWIERKDPVLPTSDFYKEWLPGRELNETPAGKVFTEAGSMTGGLGTGALSRIAAKGAGAVGRSGLEALHQAYLNPDNIALKAVQPMFVVKPKGGNWLAGSVEEALGPLRSPFGDDLATARDYLANAQRESPELVERYAAEVSRREKDAALNSWIDKQLTRYIKNEMATPEDPVRALAEKGVLHVEPADNAMFVREKRAEAGFPPEGLGRGELAKAWETASDRAIGSVRAGEYLAPSVPKDIVERNPWLAKVPPSTETHTLNQVVQGDLGFSHLVDELRNALNPESGLPRELLLKYGSLERLSVPQAVERVAKINEWRAAQAAEANLAKAQNAATFVHKEYPTIPGTDLPNERGLRWVELKAAEGAKELPEGFSFVPRRSGSGVEIKAPDGSYVGVGRDESDALADFNAINARKPLEDALKYEGDTMGHCVGGYCEDVAAGRSRIYSLRDAKGQPHVTIEVRPERSWGEDHLESFREQAQQDVLSRGIDPGSPNDPSSEFLGAVNRRMAALAADNLPQRIIQIKGKGNKAPAEDYLPFVQDFVKSGQWSDVGDLGNTGLVKLPDNRFITRQQFDEGAQSLMPEGDAPVSTDWLLRQIQRDPDWWESSKGAFEGYASGGLVEHSDTGYNPDRIDALAAQLRTELFA